MNIYNDTSKCIKCGSGQIKTIYHPTETDIMSRCSLKILIEHMHRICEKCGYGWAEEPLDKTEKEKTDVKYKEAEKETERLGQKFMEFKTKNLGSMPLSEVLHMNDEKEKTNEK